MMISLQFNTLTILCSLLLFAILLLICLGLYLYVYRKHRRITIITHQPRENRFVYPLTPISTHSTIAEELPSNYRTFDIARRTRQNLSSDSSFESSISKSKIEKISSPNSDSDELETEISNPSFEYSLAELFRLELVYKLYYSPEDHQLFFEILRLTPMQNLIEQCFSSLVCQIRLFLNDEKDKTKKLISKVNPINESFPFDIEPNNLKKSYLKLQIFADHTSDKHFEIGQTILVINQHPKLKNPTEQYTKSIPIYEDRIEMIIRQQVHRANPSYFIDFWISSRQRRRMKHEH